MPDPTAQTLRLKNGRKIGYAEYGDPQGRPTFWFHGFPDSRLEAQFSDEPAKSMGVRVVSLDRPGYGLSDYQSSRKILDWPETVTEVADSLGFDRFGVIGVSGGGPYAASCALKLAERLTGVCLVSGLGPSDEKEAMKGYPLFTRLSFKSYRWFPWQAHFAMWWVSFALKRWPERASEMMLRRLPPSDKEIMTRPEVKEGFRAVTREAFRQGSRATAHDLNLYARPWGFGEDEITTPVEIWHGDADTIVPFSMGLYQAKTIPNAAAHFYKDEGHFLVVDRVAEMLAAAVGDPAPTPTPA